MRDFLATGPAPAMLFGMKKPGALRLLGETRPEAKLLGGEDREFGRDVRVDTVVARDDASRSEHGGRQDG